MTSRQFLHEQISHYSLPHHLHFVISEPILMKFGIFLISLFLISSSLLYLILFLIIIVSYLINLSHLILYYSVPHPLHFISEPILMKFGILLISLFPLCSPFYNNFNLAMFSSYINPILEERKKCKFVQRTKASQY